MQSWETPRLDLHTRFLLIRCHLHLYIYAHTHTNCTHWNFECIIFGKIKKVWLLAVDLKIQSKLLSLWIQTVYYCFILSAPSFLGNVPWLYLLLNRAFSFCHSPRPQILPYWKEKEKKIFKDKPAPSNCAWGNPCDVVWLLFPEGSHCVALESMQLTSWHFEHNSITPNMFVYLLCTFGPQSKSKKAKAAGLAWKLGLGLYFFCIYY